MNKFTGLKIYTFFIIGVLLLVSSCDDKSDDNGPDPDQDPVSLDLEITRGTVEDIDGNVYETVIIGGQEWMAENLMTTHYNDGTPIVFPGGNNDIWLSNTSGAYNWYNDAESNKDYYGAVYNWHAVTNTARLCPDGWRVPSNIDWSQLVDYLTVTYSLSNDQNDVGGIGNRLKSCRQVRSPLGVGCLTTIHPRWNGHDNHYGFDDFGFSALPIGSLESDYISDPGAYGRWWSTSASNDDVVSAFTYYITYDNGRLFNNTRPKTNGYAVRCVR
ncbi:MAG: fibrobacter succinogenes major paralogous domain-containing protein [Bacteroidales bacterium]